ncbi:MAG: DnaD domain protein [Dehalococcoidia bacterium]|nr:MAG: DnaD domain protein [Dehalococcoidia bacterium]
MTYRVSYSAAQPGSFVQVPGTYVSQVMRQVSDPVELKVTLLVFYLLSRSREYPGYVTHADVVLRACSLLGIDEAACAVGVDAAVERGVFLKTPLLMEDTEVITYFANLESDIEAIERIKSTGVPGGGGSASKVPNIFELYEQNIGVITPIMAEELKDAQKTYPAEWVEEAFREAVKGRKQNWKYISRILERWSVEGKGSGTHRPGPLSDDPDKYVKGRYGRVVRR